MTTTAVAVLAAVAPEARTAKLSELQEKINARLQKRALELTEEVMQNMPEYAEFPWISCEDWKYKEKTYVFKVASPDSEGDITDGTPETTVTVDELSKTMPLFYMAVLAGAHPRLCITDETFWYAGNWDACVLDAFLRYHFYNELVFG